ncbi:hypothetical protein MMOR_45620 [Mycolicibacterium moriokaense]|uniref:Uncharacterized protein n=1 Tax=Mycolicibacterium moriokaense TaxID=39691 RepID=A0AAD1HEW1_9MYCO|nr:hypothetical protein MMOR_45620 [Mycolicibacterium moriokaense]
MSGPADVGAPEFPGVTEADLVGDAFDGHLRFAEKKRCAAFSNSVPRRAEMLSGVGQLAAQHPLGGMELLRGAGHRHWAVQILLRKLTMLSAAAAS